MSTRRHLPPGRPTGTSAASRSVLTTSGPATLYKTVPRPSYAPGAHELYLRKNVFVEDFASDLPRTEAVRLWVSQRGASTAAFMIPSRTAAWKTIPSWFFVSTGDRIITPDSQLAMARRARARVTTFRGGSHLTLISHPEGVRGGHRLRDLRHHPMTMDPSGRTHLSTQSALTQGATDDHLRCADPFRTK